MGVSKIGALGWMGGLIKVKGRSIQPRHLPKQTQLSCMCVCKVGGWGLW